MKRSFIGKVVSNRMQKTVLVEVERKISHSVYKKIIKKSKKFKADSNNLELNLGDLVRIEETRPMGAGKYFKVVERIGGK